ncbi:LOW QUALITY PROTEIN: transmembrane protein 72 [Lethenteron reissneri]|uniref:LOW QUALITY PROTEIN: transmembrane protein 72 n=1 Tax=Lethenteron reissneri TaxID=7753 RepID=UPI002AB7CF64|nr:LOW QUALITY PROTEIN: transmembrane protein 72 [Lethenteron reissneri]
MAKDVLSWFTVACKLLGISTAGVLWAVGIETSLDGTHPGLAVYLLISAVAITFLETAYLVDKFIMACCSPDGRAVRVWKKLAWLDYCQRFLLYGLMSVVCFLHPVAVWLATIPGIMLIASGTAYLALSYKERIRKSFTKGTPRGDHTDTRSTSTASVVGRPNGSEQIFTFESEAGSQEGEQRKHLTIDSAPMGPSDKSEDMMEKRSGTTTTTTAARKQNNQKRVRFETLHEAAEQEEVEPSVGSSAEFVTSDTAPILAREK